MKNLNTLKNYLHLNTFNCKPEQPNSWLFSYTQFTPLMNIKNIATKIRSRIEIFMTRKIHAINLC